VAFRKRFKWSIHDALAGHSDLPANTFERFLKNKKALGVKILVD
jgi:hypothetical protein